MKITLSPISSNVNDTPPTVEGETLRYRDETYDLSPLPNGAEVDAEPPFIGKIRRIDGELHLTLQYRYGPGALSNQSTNWDDYVFTVTDGKCPCPIRRRPAATSITITYEGDT